MGLQGQADGPNLAICILPNLFFVLVLAEFLFQALALPRDYINKENNEIRMGAIMGLGLAYAGSQNEQVIYWGKETYHLSLYRDQCRPSLVTCSFLNNSL